MGKLQSMFKHLKGLPNIPDLNYFELLYDEKNLYLNSIKIKLLKNEILASFEIPLERIIEAEFITEEYLKDKSVIKRAIVGSFLSPMGALIGGLSGVGKKNSKKQLYSITYLNSNDEIKNITLDPNHLSSLPKNMSFNKKFNKVLSKIPKDPKVKKILYGESNFIENEDGSIKVKL